MLLLLLEDTSINTDYASCLFLFFLTITCTFQLSGKAVVNYCKEKQHWNGLGWDAMVPNNCC